MRLSEEETRRKKAGIPGSFAGDDMFVKFRVDVCEWGEGGGSKEFCNEIHTAMEGRCLVCRSQDMSCNISIERLDGMRSGKPRRWVLGL